MVEKFFLALDYETEDEAIEKGVAAIDTLTEEFGADFVKEHVGVKVNEHHLTHTIDPRFRTEFAEEGYPVFADKKIAHGKGTGKYTIDRIIDEDQGNLPIGYLTVSAGLLQTILKSYVEHAHEHGIEVIAFTAHTKIPPDELEMLYGTDDLNEIVYRHGRAAAEAGCDTIVLDGERLKDDRIHRLPLKKLVTGIRIDAGDAGEQARPTLLGDMATYKDRVDYVVVSSRYLNKPETLGNYFRALL